MLTLGQYLQPAPDRLPVKRYVRPEQFERWGEAARQLGFEQVASSPFVRSSYRAGEMARQAREADRVEGEGEHSRRGLEATGGPRR